MHELQHQFVKKILENASHGAFEKGGGVETKIAKKRKEIKELWKKYNYNPYQLEGGIFAGEKPNTIKVDRYGHYNSFYNIDNIFKEDEVQKLFGSKHNGGVIIDVFGIVLLFFRRM